MIIIYKNIIQTYIKKITIDDVKKYALTQNENLSNEEARIIHNYIKNYSHELLNKNTQSFSIIKQNLREDLYNKIVKLYNEYSIYI